MRKDKKSVRHFEAAVRDAPTVVAYRIMLAQSLLQIGEYDRSICELEKVLEPKDRNRIALEFLGKAYALRGDYDQAVLFLQKVTRLEPYALEALLSLGDIENARKNGDGARYWYEKALLINSLGSRNKDYYRVGIHAARGLNAAGVKYDSSFEIAALSESVLTRQQIDNCRPMLLNGR